jgi:hypothetical protein
MKCLFSSDWFLFCEPQGITSYQQFPNRRQSEVGQVYAGGLPCLARGSLMSDRAGGAGGTGSRELCVPQ